MFNKAIVQLYRLKDKYIDNLDITDSIDQILKNLSIGIAAVTDIISGIVDNKSSTIKH